MNMSLTPCFKKTCLAVGIIHALSIQPTFAATVAVDGRADDDVGCTLRNAITSINNGQNTGACISTGVFGQNDAIVFSIQGTIEGLSSELIITQDVSIFAPDESIFIRGPENGRVFNIQDSNVTITNLFIFGGSTSADGGGIFAEDSIVFLTNTNVALSTADQGGGIAFRDSVATLNQVNITGNSAATDGGGIFARDSIVRINNSTISGNSTTTTGGGGDDGGGIYSRSSTVTIRNSTISGNSANDEGGGLNVRTGTVTLSNSTVSGNQAGDEGGGIIVDFFGNMVLTHSTVSNNFAARTAGGISVVGGPLIAENSIVAGNNVGDSRSARSEIFSGGGGPITFLGVNLLGDSSKTTNQAFNFTPPNSIILATSDGGRATNINSILSPLDTLGGDTLTHSLVENSPAIDAANNVICFANPINGRDQRGFERTGLCDIGAFEFGATLGMNTPDSFPIPPILFLLLDEDS